jgi:photosystem II stability/assembly factor-like uncharacterized protein
MRRSILAALAVLVLSMGAHAAEAPQLADAPLRAVQFVDDQEGWAVGDEGVIWHTIDGGQSWERQPTGVRASLRSLHFLDPFTGYVAGTESLPGGGTTGVILFTSDGGLKWQRASVKELPGLHRIKFLDKRTGYVAGTGSDLHPTGVFSTEDGGITWKPIGGESKGGWLAADFGPDQLGVLGGREGSLMALRPQGLLKAEIDGLGRRGVRAVQLFGRQAWAVGEGGLVLTSNNSAGLKWSYADVQLPPEVASAWDFHALHFVGEHGWIVGRPGSVVLHTWDKGKSWQVQQTGQSLPLHAILVLTPTGGAFPAGSIALLGADEGYLAAAVQVAASPGQHHSESTVRFAEAVRLAGGCQGETLWQFPLPAHLQQATASELAKAWGNSMDEARGYEEVIRQLVLALRIWRPDVVLTSHPDPRSAEGQAGAFVALAASKAFDLAGKADAFPEQLTKLDLQPWTPAKLYGRWDTVSGANVIIDLNTPRPQLLMSPAEKAAPAWNLLLEPGAEQPTLDPYRLLASRLDDAEKHKHLLQGIKLGIGGQARREFDPTTLEDEDWQKVVRSSQQRRDFLAIVKQEINDPEKARRLPAVVATELAGLREDQGAEAAYTLASLYARNGQWLMARELYLMMLDRYPAHRLTPEAARWLIRFGASSEARRREELKHFAAVANYPLVGPRAELGNALEPNLPKLPARGATYGTALIRRGEELREWSKSSLAVGDVLAALGPQFYQQPDVQFALGAAHRQLGQHQEPKLWCTQFKLKRSGGVWYDAAGAELWLLSKIGQPPKPAAPCGAVDAPPFLDGQLDDPCWKDAQPIPLNDAVGRTAERYPTEAWITHDANFLYLALRCKHPSDGHMKDPVRPRPRDADLRDFDRVSLLLDLDRDYATYFRLEVDQRGCVCEDCWGDRSWNPKWYVAAHVEPGCWQIEAAIPLVELTVEPIRPHQAWAFNVVRTIPGKGVQAFSTPADAEPRPEGMGLLLFQRDQPTQPMPPPKLEGVGSGR